MDNKFKPNTDNLASAVGKLRQVLEAYKIENDPQRQEIIKMAAAQAFEFTTEMSWKAMRKALIFSSRRIYLPPLVLKEFVSS